MTHELISIFARISKNDDLRVVTITGAGEFFCAGADLKERQGKDPGWIRARRHLAFQAYNAIGGCEVPVIAAVHGACVGGGCEIALAADFVIASTTATFRYPEALLGSVGATQRLPRVIGKAMAKELLFTARSIAADEAKAIGLVNRVVSREALDAAVGELTASIAAMPSLAIRLLKRCIDLGSETNFERGLAIEKMAIDQALAGDEWQEKIIAFAQ
jgi:enoyl-CoA hydratase/carnithine racemase